MKFLRTCITLSVALVIMCLPVMGIAKDSYGIGGDDYIVENGAPDLLEEELSLEEGDADLGIYDPLEPLNRVSFVFNDKLYFWVLKPVKQGYSKVVPEDIRIVIGNFFNNLAAPVNFVNTLFQGRFRDSGVVLSRFMINSSLGIFGFGDVAAEEFDLEPQRGDFGETLGVYGLGQGIYLCWPVLGPSNLRDSVGLYVDLQLHPYSYMDLDFEEHIAARGVELINRMSITPDVYEELKRISLDPYIATRQAYVDYRRNLILSHDE